MLKNAASKSLVACSVISMLALTACSGKNAGPSPSGTAAGSSQTSSGSTGTKTITLSVMTSDRFLELAKQKYEEAHPNIKIDIKEYVAAPKMPEPKGAGAGGKTGNVMINGKTDPKDIEKYVSTVGTELMSGKASDLIVMSNLPYKKYADKKLLENLSDWMGKDKSFNQGDYYTNIFDAMKYNGSLFTIPVKVSMNMVLGNLAALGGEKIDDTKWTWEDFVNLSKKLMTDKNNDGKPDYYPLNHITSDVLMNALLNSSLGKFVDPAGKKAKFDSPDFVKLLKTAKSMYDDNIIPSSDVDPKSVMFQNKANVSLYMDMVVQKQMSFDGNSAFYNLPSENDTRGTAFMSSMPVAINAKSPNKQEAWDFVKFLLSEEMQSVMELSGFAVNKKGSAEQEARMKELGQAKGESEGGKKDIRIVMNGQEVPLKPATDQDIQLIEQSLNGLKVYAESDPKITAIVTEETAPFFQGQKSAEEVAKVIQNKVGTYLQE